MDVKDYEHLYALSPTVAGGFQSKFTEGPTPEFDPAWMKDANVVFITNSNGRPRIAAKEMIAVTADMSKELYAKLLRGHSTLIRVRGEGNESVDVATYITDLEAVLSVAPWALHPKHGVVPAPERAARTAAPEATEIAQAAEPQADVAAAAQADTVEQAAPVAAAFCSAASVGAGFKGGFVNGPVPQFDASWMDAGEVPFTLKAGAQPRLAADEIVANADRISKDLFVKLYKGHKSLEKLAKESNVLGLSQDQIHTPNLQAVAAYVEDLGRILGVAPWGVDPKVGVVAVTRPVPTMAQMADVVATMSEKQVDEAITMAKQLTETKKVEPAEVPSGAPDISDAKKEQLTDTLLNMGSGPGALDAVHAALTGKSAGETKLPDPVVNVPAAAPAGAIKFHLASAVGKGFKKEFTDGPYTEFDASWMFDDAVVFAVQEGQSPRLAAEQMIEAAPCMSTKLFTTLYTGYESLMKMKEGGKTVPPVVDVFIQDLTNILVAAPYQLDDQNRIVEVPGYFKEEGELETQTNDMEHVVM